MNNQEAFTIMVNHLRKQGEKSQNLFSGVCYYRHPDKPLMCAVGPLIPDDKYARNMEQGIETLYEERPDLFPGIDLQLLVDMQWVHDDCDPRMWEFHFDNVSKNYNLTLPPIEGEQV